MHLIHFLSFFIFSFLFSSCIKQSNQGVITNPSQGVQDTPSRPTDSTLKICSALDLHDIVWPKDFPSSLWNSYFALALNITGSFEGREGWKNITNNFDNQGMSLGLMQQNFGQGSLQPLLIEMFRNYNSVLTNRFTSSDYNALKTMLEQWNGGPLLQSMGVLSQKNLQDGELFPDVAALNKLDIGFVQVNVNAASANSQSVQWAVNHLYTGSNFIARWKKSFQDTAISAPYRTLQVNASTNMFLKAKAYFESFRFKELRSLLLMFDVVVQNGGFTNDDRTAFNAWDAAHSAALEQERALALIEVRLRHVNPTYVADVRARKSSIIYGKGIVHETRRNYPVEYCFNPSTLIE